MDKTLSKGLRSLFLIHAVVAALIGVPLWLVPGRFLLLVGWVPAMVELPQSKLSVPGQTFIDEAITRLLGALLVALAVCSFQAYRSRYWEEVRLVVQMEVVFCVVGTISIVVTGLFLMHRPMPAFAWVIAAILAIFAMGWIWAIRPRTVPGSN